MKNPLNDTCEELKSRLKTLRISSDSLNRQIHAAKTFNEPAKKSEIDRLEKEANSLAESEKSFGDSIQASRQKLQLIRAELATELDSLISKRNSDYSSLASKNQEDAKTLSWNPILLAKKGISSLQLHLSLKKISEEIDFLKNLKNQHELLPDELNLPHFNSKIPHKHPLSGRYLKILSDLRETKSEILSLEMELGEIHKISLETRQRSKSARDEVAFYASIDLPELEKRYSAFLTEINSIELELARKEDLRLNLDFQMIPLNEKLRNLTEERRQLERELFELRAPPTAMAPPNPAPNWDEIIRLEKHLEAINRAINKVEGRISQLVTKAIRTVNRIVIDGNNLCYERNSPIGIRAVSLLAWKLGSTYEVLVVFDASICHITQMKRTEIQTEFPKNVSVHIVNAKTSADETILRHADEPGQFVISNDRFIDFPEAPAVRNSRLIRHEMLRGRLLISDLQIDLRYQ